MNVYYSVIILISVANLLILALLVHENGRIKRAEKQRMYTAYACLILAALAEWAAVMLNGAPAWTYGLHIFMKFADYVLSPLSAVLFVRQLGVHSRFERMINGVMLINVALEALSAFLGNIFAVDRMTNHYYHGEMFFLYVIVFMLAFLYLLYSSILYGMQYRRRNRASIAAIFTLIGAGMVIQECIGQELRVINLSLSFACVQIFVHFSEFSQQRIDEALSRQKLLLDTDILTGMLSRYAYTEHLNRYQEEKKLPENLVVFAIDVNGLKGVNDTLGHAAGDEIIRGAADCILKEMDPYGDCFRTGGDEFVALLRLPPDQVQAVLNRLQDTVSGWHGTVVRQLSISVGYALAVDHPSAGVEALVVVADGRMYENKAAYYKQKGFDRRKTQKNA